MLLSDKTYLYLILIISLANLKIWELYNKKVAPAHLGLQDQTNLSILNNNYPCMKSCDKFSRNIRILSSIAMFTRKKKHTLENVKLILIIAINQFWRPLKTRFRNSDSIYDPFKELSKDIQIFRYKFQKYL